MQLAVDSVLAHRWQTLSRPPRSAAAASAGLHALLVAALLIGPAVASRRSSEPLEFVAVRIVPVQALGVREPTPPAPARRQPTPRPAPPPKPQPQPKPPEPASRPAPEAARPPEPARPAAPEQPAAAGPGDSEVPALERRRGAPDGSSLGTSPFGATVGALDNPDFVYGYYVDQMLSMIASNWVRPALGGEIEAILHYRIHRDGRITELRIERSSGYNSFDLAGLRAVQLAAPFPPLPQSYRHGSLGVNLILR